MTHSPRVLVVDADPLTRFTVRRTLVEHGCEVVEAADGAAAAFPPAEATGVFDLVLLDYETPDGGDPSLLARLHSLPLSDRVIVMTAYATPQMMAEAARLGVTSVLNKPIDFDELCRLVTPS